MARYRSFRGTPLMLLAIVGACAGRTEPRRTTPMPAHDVVHGVPTVIVDSIASRLATLEVERAQALSLHESWSAPVRALDAQVAAYQEQLFGISLTASAPRRVAQVVLQRLDEQQATLAIRHRQLLVTYVATSPQVRAIVAEQSQVAQRRAELRASLGVHEEGVGPKGD
jgi:uncharacterized protein involved in exopolysaccharide biosynthesis